MLPNKSILEFQKIYLDQIGIELSFEEAKKEAENFIQLFDLVTKNEKKDYYDNSECATRD